MNSKLLNRVFLCALFIGSGGNLDNGGQVKVSRSYKGDMDKFLSGL